MHTSYVMMVNGFKTDCNQFCLNTNVPLEDKALTMITVTPDFHHPHLAGKRVDLKPSNESGPPEI